MRCDKLTESCVANEYKTNFMIQEPVIVKDTNQLFIFRFFFCRDKKVEVMFDISMVWNLFNVNKKCDKVFE